MVKKRGGKKKGKQKKEVDEPEPKDEEESKKTTQKKKKKADDAEQKDIEARLDKEDKLFRERRTLLLVIYAVLCVSVVLITLIAAVAAGSGGDDDEKTTTTPKPTPSGSSCSQKHTYSELPPLSFNVTKAEQNNYALVLVKKKRTWDDASNACSNSSGWQLGYMTSLDNNAILRAIKEFQITPWIAVQWSGDILLNPVRNKNLSDTNDLATIRSKHPSLSFSPDEKQRTTGASQKCLTFRHKGWISRGCTKKNFYICEHKCK